MARDFTDRCRAARRQLPCFSRRGFRWRRRLRGKPLAAAKAWPWSAPARARFAFRRDPPSSATRPRRGQPPEQIARSNACGNGPANKLPLPIAESPGWAFPSPAAPAAHPQKCVALVILRHRGYQTRGKVLRQTIQSGILLLEKARDAIGIDRSRARHEDGGDFVLIAKQKIVGMIEDLSRPALFERDFALYGDEHVRRAPGGRVKR